MSSEKLREATEDAPEGWRPEWRKPREKPARARAMPAVTAADPLPSPEELREEALRLLRELEHDPDAPVSRVTAVKLMLEHTEPDAEKHLLRILNGDEDRLLAWLKAQVARIEAKRRVVG